MKDENEDIAWSSILFVTGEIIYGGWVTDNHDRKTLNIILDSFINPDVIETENYKFSYSGIYHTIETDKMEEVLKYVESLPDIDSPEIFGMNENADVTV